MSRALLIVIGMFICAISVIAHDLHSQYVSWGVDEYELFGLNKSELKKEFKSKLFFNEDFSDAYLCPNTGRGPQFLLTFEKGRVSSVQRMFIDGGGCHLMGPVLESKEEALQFSINGLSSNPNENNEANRKRLLYAKALLKNLESSSKLTERK